MQLSDESMLGISATAFPIYTNSDNYDVSNGHNIRVETVNDTIQCLNTSVDRYNRSALETQGEMSRDSRETPCRNFTFVVYVIIFGILFSFGIIGNTLTFVVLQLDRAGHVAKFLLQSLVVADNCFLTTTAFSQTLAALTLYFDRRNHPLMAYNYKIIHPLVYITQLFTVWITVLVSFNRYIAICRPFRATKLCSFRRVRLQVAILLVSVILYGVPRFWEYRVVYVFDCDTNATAARGQQTWLKTNLVYNIVYENLLYCLFVFFGPLSILFYMNCSLIREFVRFTKRFRLSQLNATGSRPAHGSSYWNCDTHSEQNITFVIVVIVVVFVVCQTPAYLNQILYFVLADTEYRCGRPYYYFFHISNLVVSANSTLNFVVYCVFRRQFRERLLNILTRRKFKSINDPYVAAREVQDDRITFYRPDREHQAEL